MIGDVTKICGMNFKPVPDEIKHAKRIAAMLAERAERKRWRKQVLKDIRVSRAKIEKNKAAKAKYHTWYGWEPAWKFIGTVQAQWADLQRGNDAARVQIEHAMQRLRIMSKDSWTCSDVRARVRRLIWEFERIGIR